MMRLESLSIGLRLALGYALLLALISVASYEVKLVRSPSPVLRALDDVTQQNTALVQRQTGACEGLEARSSTLARAVSVLPMKR